MKILHFTHSFIPIYGGTTTRLINLLKNDGNHHYVITPGKGSKYIPSHITNLKRHDSSDNFEILRPDIPLKEYNHKKILEFISRPGEWHALEKILLKSAKDINPDLIYGHNPIEFSLAAMNKSISENIPFIFECHGLMKDSLYEAHKIPGKFYYKILNTYLISYERKILQKSKKIIVQTNTMKSRIEKEYMINPEKIEVIYNGVDLQHFDHDKNLLYREVLRKKYNFNDDDMIIGYFGFLDDNNGILQLLKKFEEISRDFSSLKLLIIGRGPYSDACRKASERNSSIKYVSMIPYDDIPKFYSVLDIFIIPRPSNPATESLVPMKIFEAMAMKKLVIVSDVKGLTEVIKHNVTGLVFKKIDELPDMINYVLAELPQRKIAEEAYKTVLEKYTWEVARKKLAQIYSSIIKQKD